MRKVQLNEKQILYNICIQMYLYLNHSNLDIYMATVILE